MARKKIREYDSKRLLKAHIARLAGLKLPINVAQVKESTNFAELIAQNPWMTQVRHLLDFHTRVPLSLHLTSTVFTILTTCTLLSSHYFHFSCP